MINPEEKFLIDLVKFYKQHQHEGGSLVGGSVLSSIKSIFTKAYNVGKDILTSPHTQKLIIGCLKGVVGKGVNKPIDENKLIVDLMNVYKKHKKHEKKGGFISLIPAILSGAISLGISLTPEIISRVKKCIQGSIKEISGGSECMCPPRKTTLTPWNMFMKNLKEGSHGMYNNTPYQRVGGRVRKM